MNLKRCTLFLFFLLSFTARSQENTIEDRIVLTPGLGASEVKQTFGTSPDTWTTRFSYRFGFGYRISKRIECGITVSVISLSPSNALYAPSPGGIILVNHETKGERLSIVGLYAKVIPFSALHRLSLQVHYGLSGYTLVDDNDYSGIGTGYCITAAYNLLNDPSIRLEPYFSFENATLNDKYVNGVALTGRGYQGYSLGVQIVLTQYR